MITFEDAKLKACRVPIRQGRAFRVFAFLDNTANPRRDEMSAEISVTKKGRTTPEGFGSGFIRGGRSSSVGDLIVPRTRAFQLVFSVETRHSAVGGNLDKEQIRRC